MPAPKNLIKSKYITSKFQSLLNDKDIRIFKNKFAYYLIFRIIRNFLYEDIIIQIYNFKVFGSIKKNKTSYFLLKKCEFGDYHELKTIKKFSDKNKKVLFLDCGSNYGFYSFYTASLSSENFVISIEASKNTSQEFLRNLKINNFKNIKFYNKAVSDSENELISFNESENDWESSQSHNNFKTKKITNIKSTKIDCLPNILNFDDYNTLIKLDIEGNEMSAIEGALKFIEKTSPIIIIEFSKYIFNLKSNSDYLNNFLIKYDYSIYDTYNKKINLNEINVKLNQLKKRYKTIGNYYLIKNNSNNLNIFLSNE
ncbi:FkbM family methyltransferase [Candidatus Pelagibacter sp.]|nr:FkbM family methyltransferase [Candidatus Pelagibacter sp.]